MRVAVAQVDGKWPNLALAKLAAWHRGRGDEVGLFNPLFPADRTYASKVFTDTPDDPYLPEDVVRGGSGYDFTTVLDDEMERTQPDWSLWPWWKSDMGYTTRGCVRRCPFCIVPKKEGKLRVVAEFGDLTTGRQTMILHDNNVTAAPIEHFRKCCADATQSGVTLDFHQGLDARLLTDEHAEIIARSKYALHIHLAFDHIQHEGSVRAAVATMKAAGVKVSRLTFYVLVGFDSTPEEDMERIEILKGLRVDPYVMPYCRTDRYQRRLARWVNHRGLFKSCSFAEYHPNAMVTP